MTRKHNFVLARFVALLIIGSTCYAPALIAQTKRAPAAIKSAAAAQETLKETRAPQAAARSAPFVNRVLPNGLEIIVLEDHSVPLVTVELAVRNGSMTEPPELNGLSHLYEHMFFKTNRAVVNREDYLTRIGQLGITYNGTTNTELVNYYFTTTTPNIRSAMQFMRDAVRYPLFDESEFERERQVVIGEIDRNESNPYFYLNQAMTEKLFAKYTSRKNPLGNRQTVGTATTEMMRLIQSRYYVPNNSAIIITGDIKPADAYALVESLFGDWTKTENPFAKYPLVEHPPLERSEGAVIEQPIQNVIIEIGWHGPSIGKDNAATYAADVFSFILRQPNSRFQRNLVDTGLVNGVQVNYLTQQNVGPITVIALTSPDKARAAIKAIHKELADFTKPDYYTNEQLEIAKNTMEAEDLYTREKPSEYAHTLSFWWASTGVDYFRGYHQNLRAVTREEINRYIRTYIHNKPRVGLALMSSEAQREVKLTPGELIGE